MTADYDVADLELNLTAKGEAYGLTIRLTRPRDAADNRRGPFLVTLDERLLTSPLPLHF